MTSVLSWLLITLGLKRGSMERLPTYNREHGKRPGCYCLISLESPELFMLLKITPQTVSRGILGTCENAGGFMLKGFTAQTCDRYTCFPSRLQSVVPTPYFLFFSNSCILTHKQSLSLSPYHSTIKL